MVGIAMLLSLAEAVALGQHYTQTNLVSNLTGIAPVTDPDLINPWGISRSSSSPWWVSDNGTGVATLYNGAGTKLGLTVTIPGAVTGTAGNPTGTIYNGKATDFLLGTALPARFLFATEDGSIVGWTSSLGAVAVVMNTDGSSYKGLTSANIDGSTYLYAANFTKGRVDVFNNAFHKVRLGEESFSDEQLPWGFAPFNVQTIGNDIVVAFAKRESGGGIDETDGPGLGYVDIFSSDGRLLRRLVHGLWLNAPWGVALAPTDFGLYSHDLLIGQFGSGNIAAYDFATGRFAGLLEDATGAPIAIDGLWSISPGNASTGNYNAASAPAAELYFTAGPDGETNGLLGYLTAVSSDLLKGNDQ
jgi:uncharacterized protein (TIGR03118 family)